VKSFHCTHCQAPVFFENVQCMNCNLPLAFLPDLRIMAAIEMGPDGLYAPLPDQRAYRLCANYVQEGVCNWAVAAVDPQALCVSCRLTRVIPNLTHEGNRAAWYRRECAKRRLVFSLFELGLPFNECSADGSGLVFEFLQDSPCGDAGRVLTGHDNGVITINVAETDDALREGQRNRQGEPYRTVLGHFRHEIGHYYWDRMIQFSPNLAAFRQLFGDERADYAQALRSHYAQGPPANWQNEFISAYASSHPWEDWAESWAHFLHMTDALETAEAAGLTLPLSSPGGRFPPASRGFDQLVRSWIPLTHVLNNLNRGLGLADSYPFVLSTTSIAKLRFVDHIVRNAHN
jgi:hypothetical protein